MRKIVWLAVSGGGLIFCGLLVIGAMTLLPSDTHDLANARGRWAARTFSRYRLVVDSYELLPCFYEVEIHDEHVATVFQSTCPGQPPTVSSLFAMIARTLDRHQCGPNGCECDGPIGVDAVHDAQLGYPHQLIIRSKPERRWLYAGYWMKMVLGGSCTTAGHIGEKIRVVSLTPLP
jgi:hypothetical protein